ncbi:MAG TPA: hypothetical protein DCM38_08540 [Gammaproteobacteria bacterium]|nr:hypothetical protein [Gammaproteobacteria bacterium]
MKLHVLKILFVLLLGILPYLSYAEVPGIISFQGYLTDDAIPINGPTDIIFSIPGTAWTEQHLGVLVKQGLFSILLGEQSSFAEAEVDFSKELKVHVQVNGISHIMPMSSVPYAFHAQTVESLKQRDCFWLNIPTGSALICSEGYYVAGVCLTNRAQCVNGDRSVGPAHSYAVSGGIYCCK